MFATLRLAALTWSGGARDEAAPSPRALLELATLRGAQALGMGNQTGSLTAGKRADVQIIDTSALHLSGFGGGDSAALIVYSARPGDVDTVLVDGRILKRNGQLTGVDVAALQARANRAARAMLERSAERP